MADSVLSIWTVYDHPTDYPESVVARRWELLTPTEDVALFPDLESARIWMQQQGLTCLPRSTNDDSNIVETWL